MQSARAATPLTCSSAMLACDPSAALQRLLRRRGRCSPRLNGGVRFGVGGRRRRVLRVGRIQPPSGLSHSVWWSADCVGHPVWGLSLGRGRKSVWVGVRAAHPTNRLGWIWGKRWLMSERFHQRRGARPRPKPQNCSAYHHNTHYHHSIQMNALDGLRASPATGDAVAMSVCVRPGSFSRTISLTHTHTHTSQKFPQPCTPSALQLRLVTVSSFHPLIPWRHSSAVS
jgi:hypothetical protein